MSDLALEVNRMAGQLRAAEELRSDFFSFVSHELKSPLTSIKGFVSTLDAVDDFTEQERAEMYGIIHDETDRLLRMINELLDLSRIQAGKPLSVNADWFDLGRRLGKVARVLRADAKGHQIDVLVPPGPVWVWADPDKVVQIVINLMSNAIKYSPSGGLVTLKLLYNESHVIISVADHGVGMTPEQCAHVFDKFYRVSENQNGAGEAAKRLRRIDGAGIGLYLTRSLVEAHHGSIAVASEPGKGSVFTVTLPKTAPEAPDAPGAADRPYLPKRAGLLNEAERAAVPHLPLTAPEPEPVHESQPKPEIADERAFEAAALNG
jgi:two-component system phosphate regulon sensor histidine kinase PhoR